MNIVFGEGLDDNNCDSINTNTNTNSLALSNTVGNTVDSGVQFVDCECYDDAINTSSSSFGDIASCMLFDRLDIPSDSYFDICVVSTIDIGNGPVATFSQALPEIIGLEHIPYDNMAFGDDGDEATVDEVSTSTFFETSCDEKAVDSQGSFAYPLFPGYGKFAGTCPDGGK